MTSIDFVFTFFLSFLLFNVPGESLSGLSSGYSNISATTSLPGSITSAPSLSATAKQCPLCQVNFGDIAGADPVRFYWFNSTLGLTLDTISIIVTQYNNTAITRTATIHGDVNSLDVSTITTAKEVAEAFAGTNDEYGDPPIVLANGTEGSLFNGISIPYPTPFVEFNRFAYTTITKQSPDCPAGQQVIRGQCECALTSWYPGFGLNDTKTTVVTLSKPYYTALDSGMGMNDNSNFFLYDNVSLSEWFMSDTALISAMPQLSTCYYDPAAHGPPGIKIPVSALTATSITTVQGSGQYTSPSAHPGDSVTALAPVSTSNAPAVSKTLSGPSESLTQPDEKPGYTHEPTSKINDAIPSDKVSPSSALILPDPPNPPQLSAGSPSPALSSDSIEISEIPKSSNPDMEPNQQNLPVSVKLPRILTPVYSLMPSETAIISNGDLISHDHEGQPTYATPEPTPILSFGTFVYTADSSSQFIISGKTLKPGGPAITVAGTPISLDTEYSAAVIGSSTQPPTTPAPIQKTPILTFAGSTFTANLASEFVVAGQTLARGSQVTVSDVPISLDSGGTIAIIGTSTQNLIDNDGPEATKAPPPPIQKTPVLAFGGSTFTANSASEFVVAGQTLAQGSQITVSDVPISLDSGGTIAIIGTSTQNLIDNYGPEATKAPPSPIEKKPVLAFGGSTFTANSASEFVVAGQTLARGSQITVSGVPISLDSGGTIAIIGTSTKNLIHNYGPEATKAPPPPIQETPVLAFGGSTFTANSASEFVVAGQTLARGSQITVSDVPISLDSGGTIAIIGTSTQNLIDNYGPEATQAPPPPIQETPVLAYGGSTFTANSASEFVVVGQTLTQGGQITVSGTPISLAQNGKTAVIGKSTQPLIYDSTPTLTRAPVFTLGATAYTGDVSSHFLIEGQTLVPGGVLTIAGTRVSYPPTGSDIVIGTSIEAIHLGVFIVQGFGGVTTATTSASTPGLDSPGNGSTAGVVPTVGVERFPGAAHRALEPGSRWGGVLVGLVVGWCIPR